MGRQHAGQCDVFDEEQTIGKCDYPQQVLRPLQLRQRRLCLRIFAGKVDGRDVFAAPWIPDASLAGDDGNVASEFVWAALDCPGAFVISPPGGKPMLLGELAVHIDALPETGSHCQVVAWLIDAQERKYNSGTALISEDGAVLACGRATWIILKQAAFVQK